MAKRERGQHRKPAKAKRPKSPKASPTPVAEGKNDPLAAPPPAAPARPWAAARAGPRGKAAYPTIAISRWDPFLDLIEREQRFRGWAFRGQTHARWPLISSLSRYVAALSLHPRSWPVQEDRVLRIFKRKAHLFLDNVPPWDDDFQWLAMMEHHGAPTRLLDFTWSPYVAAFFALENPADDDAAVWAIHPHKIMQSQVVAGRKLDLSLINLASPGTYARDFMPNDHRFVWVGEPTIMNRRLVAQSGTFAVPGTINEPLDQILADYPEPADVVAKIIFKSGVREQAMRSLYHMNITFASLFPDLEGLSRSMAYELEHHWAFDPRTLKRLRGFEDFSV